MIGAHGCALFFTVDAQHYCHYCSGGFDKRPYKSPSLPAMSDPLPLFWGGGGFVTGNGKAHRGHPYDHEHHAIDDHFS